MWMMQKFLPAMINLNDGSIVSMCSIAGHMGTPYMVPYSASKHGVKGDMIYNIAVCFLVNLCYNLCKYIILVCFNTILSFNLLLNRYGRSIASRTPLFASR